MGQETAYGDRSTCDWLRAFACCSEDRLWRQLLEVGIVERKHLSVDVSFVEATAKQSRIPWWTRPLHHSLR